MKPIDYHSYTLSRREKWKFLSVMTVCATVVLYLFYHTMTVILVAFFFALYAQRFYVQGKIKKRKEILILQFRDLLYSLSASIGAGRHMSEALFCARTDLALLYEEGTPMLEELDRINWCIHASNENEEKLLYDLGKRSGVRDITAFAEIYYICLSTGGDLVRVVGITSQMLLDKLTIVQDIRSYTAQKRFEGKMIAVIPPFLLFFLTLTSPEYLLPLYIGTEGRILMTLALILLVMGYLLADHITDISMWEDEDDKKLLQRKERKKGKTASAAKCDCRTAGLH